MTAPLCHTISIERREHDLLLGLFTSFRAFCEEPTADNIYAVCKVFLRGERFFLGEHHDTPELKALHDRCKYLYERAKKAEGKKK